MASLFDDEYIPSPIETERRKRIRLSVFAYAYEFDNNSLISDEEYDKLSREINPQIKTGHDKLDKFFETQFEPDTGMWIRKHPELTRVRTLYLARYKKDATVSKVGRPSKSTTKRVLRSRV